MQQRPIRGTALKSDHVDQSLVDRTLPAHTSQRLATEPVTGRLSLPGSGIDSVMGISGPSSRIKQYAPEPAYWERTEAQVAVPLAACHPTRPAARGATMTLRGIPKQMCFIAFQFLDVGPV
jgi:hypothetical protein